MAFEGIDASELYPCVLFYSTVFGEKVISLSATALQCNLSGPIM